MRSKFFLIGAVLFVIFVGVFKGIEIFIENKIEPELRARLKEACASCKVEIGKIDFDFIGLELFLGDVKFVGGRRAATQVQGEIPVVLIKFQMPWGKSPPTVKSIWIKTPMVTVYEGDEKLGKSEPMPPSPLAIIKSVQISKGRFTYIREHDDKKAPIRVKNIDAKVDEFRLGTENFVEMKATAKLEDSGEVNMKTRTLLFGSRLDMHIENVVENQNLSELNGYFENFEGVRVTGYVVKSRSVTDIRGDQAHTVSEASYRDLDLEFQKNHKRSAVAAFFANLGKELTLDKKSTDESRRQRTKSATVTRDPEETLVSFIVRSNGEAGMKITVSH